jgi:molybdate transport system ATP-binding protein
MFLVARIGIAMSEIKARFRIDRGSFVLDVDLTLPGKGISALFGHSGSGKTTVLRAMAGLEKASAGYFALGNEVWQDANIFLPPHKRPVGYVFQEASLFPHLSVMGNLEFGLKRIPAGERHFRPEAVAELLNISNLLGRRPDALSGGERQRVAIARALLASPRLLLMDEPLAALDLKLKQEILPYLERLHDELSIPVIYVSHAPDEVARLADHLVLLDGGRTVASGPLPEVLARVDLPPAFSDEAGVVLETHVAAHEEDDLTRLEFPGGFLLVSRHHEMVGQRLRCRIHARDVSLSLETGARSSILNRLPARVVEMASTETPGHILVRLDLAGTPLLARITRRSAQALGIAPGQNVVAQIKSVALL